MTGPTGSIIANDVTDWDGAFLFPLPQVAGMELTVVGTSLVGIPVHPGDELVLILP